VVPDEESGSGPEILYFPGIASPSQAGRQQVDWCDSWNWLFLRTAGEFAVADISRDVAFLSIRELARRLRAQQLTSVALTEFFLGRLEQIGPRLNAVVTVTRDVALRAAAQADKELKAGIDRGPLHGIPYGAKDLLATTGIPTTYGARPFEEQVLDHDATVIVRLREAGAVLAAKLAMVEIAGGLGYRQSNASFTGPGCNPWDRSRWSGGSSSGPGAAVGGGLVPFAVGSETWGSIMTPAGFCGISGLRPTYGRVSRHGAMALSWTMDKLGPMCRTADDCGVVLAAISGVDPADPTSVDREFSWKAGSAGAADGRWKLGVFPGVAEQAQPEIRDNYERSLETLAEFADFAEIELDPELPWTTVPATIINCEAAAAWEGLITTGDIWEMTAEEDHWGIHSSMVIPAKDYINALRIRRRLQRSIDQVLSAVDAIVSPTLATVAYPNDRPWSEYRRGFSLPDGSRLGGAGNACGLPAISVPNGFGELHLPTGLQFTGRAFDEVRLLQLAAQFQARTDWHLQTPEDD